MPLSAFFLFLSSRDTRSAETTIERTQNMQICHKLSCKQIDMSTLIPNYLVHDSLARVAQHVEELKCTCLSSNIILLPLGVIHINLY